MNNLSNIDALHPPSCLSHGSLFSGIGGFDLAAQWMKWNNIFQVEKDDWCRKVLAKNFPKTERFADIKDFTGYEYTSTIDVISGGFPCQPFSVAGQRKGKDDDRYLWEELCRKSLMKYFLQSERSPGITAQYMKSKALERAGKADRVKCCVQTDRTKDLIPALFFICVVSASILLKLNNLYMKKQKLYFSDFEEERAYTLDYIIEEMKERELTECEVALAIRDDDKSYFFCRAIQEVCVKPPEGEPCGKECCDYEPRNGKSGCCKFRGFCYMPGDEFKLSIDGKLTPLVS